MVEPCDDGALLRRGREVEGQADDSTRREGDNEACRPDQATVYYGFLNNFSIWIF